KRSRIMPRARLASHALTAALAWVLGSSCVPSLSQNRPREPSRSVPATFQASHESAGSPSPVESSAGQRWSDFFTDPQLRALIETALRSNQELNIRLQEIIIAKSEVMSRQGEYIPRVDARVGGG